MKLKRWELDFLAVVCGLPIGMIVFAIGYSISNVVIGLIGFVIACVPVLAARDFTLQAEKASINEKREPNAKN